MALRLRVRRSLGVGVAAAALLTAACDAPRPSAARAAPGEQSAAATITPTDPPRRRSAAALPAPEPITPAGLLGLVASLPGPRDPASPGHAAAQEWLRTSLAGLGGRLREQPFSWSGLPDHDLRNLEWTLPGPSPEAPLLMVCAHYDSVGWSPGADDNGSGVAVLLTLARRLAPRRLPCEVRLVFLDAEERGLVGSRHHALSLSDGERARTVGVINVEAVGYADRRPGSQAMPPFTDALFDVGDVGDFALVLANQGSADLAGAVTAGLASGAGDELRVVIYDRLPGVGWLIPDSRRSDHASYWDVGIPAVMITDTASFRNPHYHRRGDRVETLDGAFLAAVARGVERAVLLLATEAAGE